MRGEIVPRTALVVDDEALIRWSLSEALTDAGWTVRQAATGAQMRAAVQTLEGQPFVVLLDLRMPDVSDLSLMYEIRAARPDVPVLVMTAFGTVDDRARALAAGVHAFVDKPFDVNEVIALVGAAAARPPQ